MALEEALLRCCVLEDIWPARKSFPELCLAAQGLVLFCIPLETLDEPTTGNGLTMTFFRISKTSRGSLALMWSILRLVVNSVEGKSYCFCTQKGCQGPLTPRKVCRV